MPTYDYRCDACGKVYDIFHKVREVAEDVVCPSCGSPKATRLISAPRINAGSAPDQGGCGEAGCCGGACNMN